MRCERCNRAMTALFISYACDYCDGLVHDELPFRGFVVYRQPAPNGTVREEYVFRTRRDAERWRTLQSLDDCEIREVRSAAEFRWRKSQGSLRGIELADKLFEIYPDRRYEPSPRRAHVA